ncbi:hypothetical protein GCM10010218_56640 [Streptomyces mashuensis]|uniref:Uncharacterized protein n=1 Tax=Streptomyces mashuensis TaxID=33904 RepID=A0A919B8S2_9ACTN|nr:hypothetical protein [Streptomyces mashuensis]GHF67807.1 hypothetical protein GCM10010218_56640 [Streptomyces mashuensis]
MSHDQPGSGDVSPQPPQHQPPYQQGPGYPTQPGLPPPYGGPPGPPYGGPRRGRAVGITVGVVLLAGVLVAGGLLLLRDKEDPKPGVIPGPTAHSPSSGGPAPSLPPERRFRLTTPETLVQGRFVADPGQTDGGYFGDEDQSRLAGLGVADATKTARAYESAPAVTPLAVLRFSGMWGKVQDPANTVENVLRFVASSNSNASASPKPGFEGSAEKETPAGVDADTVVKCQKWNTRKKSKDESDEVRIPVCVWADHSTVGVVQYLDGNVAAYGYQPSLPQTADVLAQVYHDTRTPAG